MFVLSFENESDRTSFSKCYVPNVQINDVNVLIDGKSVFNMQIKNDEETFEQIIEMGRNNDYMTGNLLDYEFFCIIIQINCNKLKQTKWIRKPWFKTTN